MMGVAQGGITYDAPVAIGLWKRHGADEGGGVGDDARTMLVLPSGDSRAVLDYTRTVPTYSCSTRVALGRFSGSRYSDGVWRFSVGGGQLADVSSTRRLSASLTFAQRF